MLPLDGFDSTVCFNCVGPVFLSLDQTEQKTRKVYTHHTHYNK